MPRQSIPKIVKEVNVLYFFFEMLSVCFLWERNLRQMWRVDLEAELLLTRDLNNWNCDILGVLKTNRMSALTWTLRVINASLVDTNYVLHWQQASSHFWMPLFVINTSTRWMTVDVNSHIWTYFLHFYFCTTLLQLSGQNFCIYNQEKHISFSWQWKTTNRYATAYDLSLGRCRSTQPRIYHLPTPALLAEMLTENHYLKSTTSTS